MSRQIGKHEDGVFLHLFQQFFSTAVGYRPYSYRFGNLHQHRYVLATPSDEAESTALMLSLWRCTP